MAALAFRGLDGIEDNEVEDVVQRNDCDDEMSDGYSFTYNLICLRKIYSIAMPDFF